ncbi:MAG: PHP domain-containing protein [Clostridiales bacterium]|nr:PHP domain-containing protein [Clostridiales bacterium]
MKQIDLHMHTNKSDGALTPKQIIDEAVKANLQAISITDHDTIDAYTDETIKYAKEQGIKLIVGVEISTKSDRCGIHVLGYNFDLNNEEFKQKLDKIRNARHDYLKAVAKKLEALNYKINVEELDKIKSVTKAHISKDIIENEKNKEELLKQFGHIPNKGEFIETIMNENCPAYVQKVTVTPETAAEMIRKAGGKVVLAHPVAYANEDNMTVEEVQQLINKMKPDGLEAYYIYTNRNNEYINEIDKWLKLAKDNNLFATIGSDFHMKDGHHAEIGMNNVGVQLEEETIKKILSNLI